MGLIYGIEYKLSMNSADFFPTSCLANSLHDVRGRLLLRVRGWTGNLPPPLNDGYLTKNDNADLEQYGWVLPKYLETRVLPNYLDPNIPGAASGGALRAPPRRRRQRQ